MVRNVNRTDARKYLDQATEFLESAQMCLNEGRFNAATFIAIQAMINANDALTIHVLEKRASSHHGEATELHELATRPKGDPKMKNHLKDALKLRANAGYIGDSVSKKGAKKALSSASAYVSWVKDRTGLK